MPLGAAGGRELTHACKAAQVCEPEYKWDGAYG